MRGRQEGVFFAALSFSSKTASGLGGAIASFGIDIIRLPTSAVPGEVSAVIIRNLGWLCGPVTASLAIVSAVAFSRYGLRREHVTEIQTELASRREVDRGPIPSSQSS